MSPVELMPTPTVGTANFPDDPQVHSIFNGGISSPPVLSPGTSADKPKWGTVLSPPQAQGIRVFKGIVVTRRCILRGVELQRGQIRRRVEGGGTRSIPTPTPWLTRLPSVERAEMGCGDVHLVARQEHFEIIWSPGKTGGAVSSASRG